MAGLYYLNSSSWRYDNAGTADTLITTATTLENLDETKSKTGTAFYQTAQAKCFDLPATDEVWLKFDVYFNGSQRWRAYNGGANGVTGVAAQTNSGLSFFANGNHVDGFSGTNGFSGVCKTNTLQTVLLHMISGSSAGIIEAWVDGTKIYTYTGDVNHGTNFADIYLQSDGSGTFFSNVTISNVKSAITTFDCELKPEIYISWIPTGKISLKPQIYATIIQAPTIEKARADLSRNISKAESASGDLNRQVGNGETVSADVYRHVFSTDTAVADTTRKLFTEEKVSGDTLKKIVQSDEIHADTLRNIQSTEKVIGDTSRKIGVTTISADLYRQVNVTTRADGDTCRRVEVEEKVSGDLALKVTCAEVVHADTFRKVEDSTPTVARADTNRKIGVREKISANTRRLIAQKESAIADTLLQTAATEKVIADTMRGIREIVRADTLRQVTRAERAVAKTIIRVPHVLNYILQSKPRTMKASPKLLATDNSASLINTFKDYGVTAIHITLSEKTLSDDFRFDVAARSMDINEAVQGYLLDYPFSFLVEETNQTDIVQSVKGRYSIDELIYTQFFIHTVEIETKNKTVEVVGGRIQKGGDGETEIYYPTAQDVMSETANYFGMLPVMLFDDFTPYNLTGDQRITYADLLSTVFNWTSRLPQRQINIFIRDDSLYCIQRGQEPFVLDISEMEHSRPTINKKLIRSLWSNPKATPSNPNDDPSNPNDPITDYQVEYLPQPFSGTISFEDNGCSTTLRYSQGLLMREENYTENAKATLDSSVSYAYEEIFPADMTEISISVQKSINPNFYGDFYLFEKNLRSTARSYEDKGDENTLKETSQSGKTEYRYLRTGNGEVYLSSEYEETTTVTYETDEKGNTEQTDDKTDVRETFHVPIGNGWYGQSVYLNGESQGSNVSQGKPGNKVSQYMTAEVQKTFSNAIITITEPNPNYDDGDDDDDDDKEDYDDWRRKLAPIADTSFPVRELNLLRELTSDLLWLNRKIEETVTVDLISKIIDGVPKINHIVDFTQRIKFNGAEYYLVSNKISFTPRKLIQKLQLIRWY